jgi:hypothetical protein
MRKTICIACSIFKNDLEQLRNEGVINVPVVYLDSMLHMKPQKLSLALSEELEKHGDKNIILAYGDCHAEMDLVEKRENVQRIPGINCCNILLGAVRYKMLMKEGAFFLLNEWVERWHDVFYTEFGFRKSADAKLFMKEMHTKLVYLDTGIQEIPVNTLYEISEYCGLPWLIEHCSSEELAHSINMLSQLYDYER